MIKSIGMAVLISTVQLSGMRPQAELQPDQALSIARSIGDYEGYTPSKLRGITYEITDPTGKETYEGYISLQILVNTHPAHFLSINKTTGHVVDFEFCQVLDYKIIHDEERKFGIKYLKVKNYDKEMIDNGCIKYNTILNRKLKKYPG